MLLEIGDRWMLMGTPVVEGVPARTLYWLGEFDGTRFIPDDPAPRQFDILATYRAPTIARGPQGDLVAIGIIADEIRDEQERHEAGWVHVLTLRRSSTSARTSRGTCARGWPLHSWTASAYRSMRRRARPAQRYPPETVPSC
jgi:hypothetical protein